MYLVLDTETAGLDANKHPILSLSLGIYTTSGNIFKELENATITFSMVDLNTGRHKVFNKPGIPIPMNKTVCPEETEYYIGYKFDKKDTNTPGLYRGEFKIDFMGDGCSLIVPIRDELHITILDSTTNSKIIC